MLTIPEDEAMNDYIDVLDQDEDPFMDVYDEDGNKILDRSQLRKERNGELVYEESEGGEPEEEEEYEEEEYEQGHEMDEGAPEEEVVTEAPNDVLRRAKETPTTLNYYFNPPTTLSYYFR
eukprot:Platyproteum_vivax@DN11944_c0_g1_i1.p1